MKLYFREDDCLFCYTKKGIIEQMKDQDIQEIKVFEAQRVLDEGFFYCTLYHETGIKGESCGKDCEGYKPRNGKNGRCRFSSHCYEATEKAITIKMKA